MGTDNLFHKQRKPKSAKQLRRGQPKRAAYEKILIVCEGEKTEPHYFMGARNYYGLSTVNVEVRGDSGADPSSVECIGLGITSRHLLCNTFSSQF